MISNMNVYNLAEGLNLHCIESPKFKTNVIGFFLRRPLKNEEATKNALISNILRRACEKLPSTMALNVELDNLYGTVLMSDVMKNGESQVIEVALQFPNKKHIPDKKIFDKEIELLKELIMNPFVTDEGFDEILFNEEKFLLEQEIKSRVNDKMHYSLERCIEIMCSDEPYRIYKYGDLESLEIIDRKELLSYYRDMLKNSPIDVIVIGDVNSEEVYKCVKSNFDVERSGLIEIEREQTKKSVEKVRYEKEEFDVQQGKLNLGFRMNISYEDPLYHGGLIFSYIFGGGANSKLFKNVREKESLCYYIFSHVEKFKSLMLVGSGIEVENYQKTLELILLEFENTKKGDFSEEELELAKLTVGRSLKAINDSQHSFMGFYYSQLISSKVFNIDELIDSIKSVSKEDIIEAGKFIELDTVHFLSSKEGGIQ